MDNYVGTHTYIHTHTHTHLHTHTYIHAYIHTYILQDAVVIIMRFVQYENDK